MRRTAWIRKIVFIVNWALINKGAATAFAGPVAIAALINYSRKLILGRAAGMEINARVDDVHLDT